MSSGSVVLILGVSLFLGVVVLRVWVSAVVPRVVEGGACGLPVMLPGGAVEARGSRVPRKRHRVSDAGGALDLGGTVPQAARHHRRHPHTRQSEFPGRRGCWAHAVVGGEGGGVCS